MDASTLDAAAGTIWKHWAAGTKLEALPPGQRPGTRAEGYAIQAGLQTRSGRPLAGWKIAATSTAGQRHINVDGPLAGRLLAERVFPDGAALAIAGNRMRVAEPEFAFRMARDLAPRHAPYTVDEVLDAVATLQPALEVPDSRFEDFTIAGGPQLIADNACAHEFVIGMPTALGREGWRELDLVAYTITARVAGKLEREGRGENVLGDPRVALCWLANEVSGLGLTLHAGEVVTTGVCTVPLPIGPGDAVSADFGALGIISLRFRDA